MVHNQYTIFTHNLSIADKCKQTSPNQIYLSLGSIMQISTVYMYTLPSYKYSVLLFKYGSYHILGKSKAAKLKAPDIS